MATSEELFISVSPQTYLENKSSTLMSQAELLHTLKHLQNLKVLSRQKNDLKKTFYKLASSISNQIDSIQKKMPTPEVPEEISNHEVKQEPHKTKKTSSRQDEIEEELRLIHSKLQQLNAAN